MTVRIRLALLAAAAIVIAIGGWHVIVAMPRFGAPTSAYGQAVNALIPHARGISNMIAAVNFDVRGIDTLGEESMLLCAVAGAVVLLRGSRGEDRADRAGRVPGRAIVERDDATIFMCRAGATLLILFGAYVALHGTVTPGGGFQGGVIVASGLLLVYLGEGYGTWRAVVKNEVLAAAEGAGAVGFVASAAAPLLLGQPALTNMLPFGTWKDLYSGGLMVVVNLAVACAVGGGFGVLLVEFLEETRAPDTDDKPEEEKA